ncbi:hypothetical protein C8R43DRAFT_1046045 [Mycena crocata]|nr:hypothetical protein C8R43DRAFT_1046045 [Mycena crocata]
MASESHTAGWVSSARRRYCQPAAALFGFFSSTQGEIGDSFRGGTQIVERRAGIQRIGMTEINQASLCRGQWVLNEQRRRHLDEVPAGRFGERHDNNITCSQLGWHRDSLFQHRRAAGRGNKTRGDKQFKSALPVTGRLGCIMTRENKNRTTASRKIWTLADTRKLRFLRQCAKKSLHRLPPSGDQGPGEEQFTPFPTR